MPLEKANALVVRFTDYSETSRIVTLFTREFGKVRALAKGARRPKSNFESALDLLTVCSIVLLRKSSGGLDLLTEARVAERFGALRRDLQALYAGYYIAELLGEGTEDGDPHPALFDAAVESLRALGAGPVTSGLVVLRFEAMWLRELGYAPILTTCAACHGPLPDDGPLAFSPAAGGVVCPACQGRVRGGVRLSGPAWQALGDLADAAAWTTVPAEVRPELRGLLNQYVCYVLGRRPRTMAYLGG